MAKIKNIEAFCSFCDSTTKMELANDSNLVKDDVRKWAKCKKCKQKVLVTLGPDDKKLEKIAEFVESDVKTYSPREIFSIGDSLYHQSWDDSGVVISKRISSNGQSFITVRFNKLGDKQLIEISQRNEVK